MNYLKVYCKLVRKFEERNLTREEGLKIFDFCEEHHIWMRSIYGEEKDGNTRTIIVSAREHFILHAVLEKAYIKRYGLHHWKTKKATFSIILMKSYGKYYNSRLYKKARVRANLQKCKPIRIYFADGKVIDWYEGKPEFCKQNPQYTHQNMSALQWGKYNNHRDIIKIELIDKDNPVPIKPFKKDKPISKHAKQFRIYFNDGRIIEYKKGLKNFCRENPKYEPNRMGNLLNKLIDRYKDIIKIEYLDPKKEQEKYIKKERCYSADLFFPIKIYFKNGICVECKEGISHFSRESNRYYKSNKLLLVLKGERKRHKDIIKIVKTSSIIEVHPQQIDRNTKKLVKIDLSKIDYTSGDY